MERKIGEIFEFKKDWYQCVEGRCKDCHFSEKRFLCKQFIAKDFCTSGIIFKKLEKVGEPYNIGKKVFQRYGVFIKPYIFNDRFFTINTLVEDLYISIEIKQNKEEDMKTVKVSKDDLNFLVNKIRYGILPKYTSYDEIISEITDLFSVEDVILSDSENIGKNLKPFDLQAAKSGKPVCTRDGKKARIICFDVKGDICPIIALVEENGMEVTKSYDENGRANYKNADNYDLTMLPEKKEGWVNVYYDNDASSHRGCRFIYDTKERAVKEAGSTYITTVKISWEE